MCFRSLVIYTVYARNNIHKLTLLEELLAIVEQRAVHYQPVIINF